MPARTAPDAMEIARNMTQSPDNWPPMRVKQVAEALVAARALNADLLRELRSMTLLAKSALLCTSVEIARDAKPLLAAADAVIAKAGA